jgi:tRNA threonylcarbamoyl adenosine modification protein YeaZ
MSTNSPPLTLAIDSGSPTVSIALGSGSELLAETSFPGGPASPPLLGPIHELLAAATVTPTDLDRLIAVRGPGSFTGLRSGLATILGLHQALGVPATAVPTFLPLVCQISQGESVVGAVDALRGEWFVQPFGLQSRQELAPPSILPPDDLLKWAPCTVIAFRSDPLRQAFDSTAGIEVEESAPLAPELLRLASEPDLEWRAESLVSPLYLRPPAAKKAARRR